jgi:hypothetical protein
MGFFKKITRQISIKNISPIARVVSVAKPTIKKVIDTKQIGIKDYIALSPVGIAMETIKTGTSNIKDVVVDKPIEPVADVKAPLETDLVKPASTTPTPAPAVATAVAPAPKKPNVLMYAGIGVGVLVLGYFGYRLMKK